MRSLIYFSLFLLLFSCSETTNEEITLDDLKQIKTTKEYTDEKPENKAVNEPKGTALTSLADTLMGKGNWKEWDTLFYPQRFGPTKLETWICSNEKDSLSLVELCFGDSLKTFNAFYNWLDCYGPKCQSIKLLEPFKSKSRNTLILVKSGCILFVEGNRAMKIEHVLFALEEKKKKQHWNYIIASNRGKKAQWFSADEGILTELK